MDQKKQKVKKICQFTFAVLASILYGDVHKISFISFLIPPVLVHVSGLKKINQSEARKRKIVKKNSGFDKSCTLIGR